MARLLSRLLASVQSSKSYATTCRAQTVWKPWRTVGAGRFRHMGRYGIITSSAPTPPIS